MLNTYKKVSINYSECKRGTNYEGYKDCARCHVSDKVMWVIYTSKYHLELSEDLVQTKSCKISLGLFMASVFRLKNLSSVKYDKYWEAASSYLCPAGGEREKQAKINTVLVLQHGEVSLWCWLSYSCPLCLPLPGLHCQPLHSQPSWSQSVVHIPLYHVPIYLWLMTIETKTKQMKSRPRGYVYVYCLLYML